ncbi:MAG: JAB domain-containing protein [Lutibacter sp.]|jgi:DNA repair protein RadC
MKTYKSNISAISLKLEKSDYKKVKIQSSQDAANYARQFYFDDLEIYESFFLILLNRANNTIGYAKISQGGVAGTVVDVKIIAKYAIDCLAASVILVHNHPSGNKQPSTQDIEITKKIRATLQFCDIAVLDHVIITSDSYFSLADNGNI